ncbi:MAG TPA: LppP/LprE family lipoprotein [Solirubrobacteraceae bacterium]|nr:LppP/LprE family lipoprotein [Solirubrobacteraceae bacterium]
MPRRDQVRHPRSPAARWARRVLGVAGTAVVLAVGVVAATMALSAVDDEAVTPAPVAAASPERRSQPAGKRTPRLSARRRAERRRALDQLRRHGYRPVKPADYRPEQVLRVLIGEPVGTTPAGLRAFFFARGEYIGQDATSASLGLRPGRQREREITLVYKLYQEGDRECCPEGGKARVRFRWTGEALEPRDAIPPDYQRLPATVAQ